MHQYKIRWLFFGTGKCYRTVGVGKLRNASVVLDVGGKKVPGSYVSLDEAAATVKDGYTLALGGMTLYRRPVSFVKALLRRSRAAAGANLA